MPWGPGKMNSGAFQNEQGADRNFHIKPVYLIFIQGGTPKFQTIRFAAGASRVKAGTQF